MKDHSSWEGWVEMEIHQEKKFNQIEEDEENKKNKTFHQKSVYSQVKQNQSTLERLRGYHGQSSRKDGRLSNWKNAVEWKPIKSYKKK